MSWAKSLPFALDLGGFRAVHACWHPELLERLNGKSLADHDFLLTCAEKFTPEWEAVEAVLKGIEVPLPDGHFFTDHTGTKRSQFRARWWEMPRDGVLASELVFPASDQISAVPVDADARAMFQPYAADERPVFFDHYFKPADSKAHPERHNVACLDHSAATGGPLMAYRWKGESNINPAHYVTSHEN